MEQLPLEALADRLFNAIALADFAEVERCYAPAIEVWHNYSGVTQDREGNLKMLRWLHRIVTDYRYTEISRTSFDGGFVQRHTLRCVRGDVQIVAPACVVGYVEDGRILRLYEYMDSAQIKPLLAR